MAFEYAILAWELVDLNRKFEETVVYVVLWTFFQIKHKPPFRATQPYSNSNTESYWWSTPWIPKKLVQPIFLFDTHGKFFSHVFWVQICPYSLVCFSPSRHFPRDPGEVVPQKRSCSTSTNRHHNIFYLNGFWICYSRLGTGRSEQEIWRNSSICSIVNLFSNKAQATVPFNPAVLKLKHWVLLMVNLLNSKKTSSTNLSFWHPWQVFLARVLTPNLSFYLNGFWICYSRLGTGRTDQEISRNSNIYIYIYVVLWTFFQIKHKPPFRSTQPYSNSNTESYWWSTPWIPKKLVQPIFLFDTHGKFFSHVFWVQICPYSLVCLSPSRHFPRDPGEVVPQKRSCSTSTNRHHNIFYLNGFWNMLFSPGNWSIWTGNVKKQ